MECFFYIKIAVLFFIYQQPYKKLLCSFCKMCSLLTISSIYTIHYKGGNPSLVSIANVLWFILLITWYYYLVSAYISNCFIKVARLLVFLK